MSRLSKTVLTLTLFFVALAMSVPADAAGRQYKVLRWTEDWTWLETDMPADSDPFDSVKNVELGDDWRFSLGGSFRLRFEADDNRTLGASPVDDSELMLFRTFLHFQFQHANNFRWFAEFRYSDTWGEDRPVGAVFRDDPDVQNFFLEFKAAADTSHPVTFRIGRQELLFGAQRLISPLNWSSTRRTFDGISVDFKTPRTNTFVFATYPVMHEIHDIDSANDDMLLWGAHWTMKPADGHHVEAYGYFQDDDRDIYANEAATTMGDLQRNTLGARYLYTRDGWKADLEAALQSGDFGTDDISAWMFSGTGGYTWGDVAWKPSLDFGLDLASGDGDPTDGDRDTFNHLFPLGHAYFGHIDLNARQNMEAYRIGLTLKPRKGLKWVTTLHRFQLMQEEDALYSAGGGVIRRDPTGGSGDDVATELDVLLAYSWATHHSVALELTKWWSDDFIENTGDGDDAWFAWLAYEFKF
jgi:hypothetical protein